MSQMSDFLILVSLLSCKVGIVMLLSLFCLVLLSLIFSSFFVFLWICWDINYWYSSSCNIAYFTSQNRLYYTAKEALLACNIASFASSFRLIRRTIIELSRYIPACHTMITRFSLFPFSRFCFVPPTWSLPGGVGQG